MVFHIQNILIQRHHIILLSSEIFRTIKDQIECQNSFKARLILFPIMIMFSVWSFPSIIVCNIVQCTILSLFLSQNIFSFPHSLLFYCHLFRLSLSTLFDLLFFYVHSYTIIIRLLQEISLLLVEGHLNLMNDVFVFKFKG